MKPLLLSVLTLAGLVAASRAEMAEKSIEYESVGKTCEGWHVFDG